MGLFFVCLLSLVAADLVTAVISTTLGSLRDPPAKSRVRFRYHLPDASVDSGTITQDIQRLAKVGAGGMEFLPFFEYGGTFTANPVTNWSTYNFGTPPFVELFKTALTAHADNGLLMDFAIGPNQGQGVPAEAENPGLQWDMAPFTSEIPQNGQLEGRIPGWGTGDLVALVTALVQSNKTVAYEASGLGGYPATVVYDDFKLNHATLAEQTQLVGDGGIVKLSLPVAANGTHYRLFAFYERLSGHKNVAFPSNVHDSIFDSGSYAVDHFDTKGASVVTQFWDKRILTDEVLDLVKRVGNYGWEDSIELIFNVTWSKSLPRRFEKLHGYSIRPYLPLLTFGQNTFVVQPAAPGKFRCVLDTDDEGLGYVNDYRAALVEGYKEYLTTLAQWMHQKLGIKLSVQPAYGSTMDMLATVPFVDAPECETLSFFDNIDQYRAFSGPARLSGKRVISNELGAISGLAYDYHFSKMMYNLNRAFVGGINQIIVQGQTFAGLYPNTTWPGHTPFVYLFSEPWSPKLPTWKYGLKQVVEYANKVQHIFQNSVAKADVVLYHKQSATTMGNIYQADDLLNEGWSWNYLSSDNLLLHEAKVQKGVLAPDGPAWKAFVVESSQNLTLTALRSLQVFAQKGLPIIISGGTPGYYPTASGHLEEAKFEPEIERLIRSRNVYSVSSGHVADKLRELGIRPLVQTDTNGTCYTNWAESEGVGYAMVFSDSTKSTGSITVASTKPPFYINAWTGKIQPVLIYERTRTATIIPIDLEPNQAIYLAFADRISDETVSIPSYHVQKAPSQVVGVEVNNQQKISLHVARSDTPAVAVLSTDRKIWLDSRRIDLAFELSNWTLTVEHWEAPKDLYESEHTYKYNTTHHLTKLVSWTAIPELVNVSGVGYYASSFQWPPNEVPEGTDSSQGAYLRFPRLLDTLTVSINGHALPQLDITNAVMDVTQYLRHGENTVQAIIPTTLRNYVRSIIGELFTAGIPATAFGASLPRSEAGLLADVAVVPVRIITV